MNIRPIKSDADHALALAQVEQLWGAPEGTPEAEHLEVLVTLIDLYEAGHHVIDPPDPIEAIRFRMEQQDCPTCEGRMRVIAHIEEPEVVVRILRHLGLPTAVPPTARARPPPEQPEQLDCWDD